MNPLLADFRIALRGLRKARGFSATVILTLGLALALGISVVAVVNAYLIRPLPYPAADRIYGISYARPGEPSLRGLAELPWDAVSDVVEHPIAWDLDVFYLIGGEHPESAPGTWVTPGFMAGFGIRPMLGRAFVAEEFVPGGPQVALISHSLWRGRFGGDSSVVGRRFEAYVSDRPEDPELFTIVGVLPPAFWHLNPYTQVLTPLRAPSYPYLVRLREGVTPAVAAARITDLVRNGASGLAPGRSVELRQLQAGYTRTVRPILYAVGAAVTLVLLIAAANVAFLALIRGARREKEVALRLALGARRSQVARLLGAEALLLALAAGMLGIGLALALLRGIAPGVERQLGRPIPGGQQALTLDGGVLVAAFGLVLLMATVLALAPLLAGSRRPLFALLRRVRQTSGDGARARRSRSALIAVEVGGSLALLVGSGLLLGTVARLLRVDLGLEPARVVTATFGIRERSYPDSATRIAFFDRLLREVEGTPGVAQAALATPSPLTEFEPAPLLSDADGSGPPAVATLRSITAGYFDALAVPLRAGRDFAPGDRAGAEPVAILSEAAAARLWPGRDAVGRRIRVVERTLAEWDTVTATRVVVGVVKDVRHSPSDSVAAEVYIPLLQSPGRFAAIVFRSEAMPRDWFPALREVMRRVDAEVPVGAPRALEDVVTEQLARPRFLATLFAGFGGFATLLALLGIYGVIAYAARQREHEIAIRLAIGADPGAIRRLFLRQGAVVLGAGLLLGIPAAVGIGKLLRAQLFGVAPLNPVVLLSAALALGATGLLAIWWPCRRASGVDPVGALREE